MMAGVIKDFDDRALIQRSYMWFHITGSTCVLWAFQVRQRVLFVISRVIHYYRRVQNS